MPDFEEEEDLGGDARDEDSDAGERESEFFGCVFGAGVCCMPGLHTPSECHTAEMAEAMVDEEFHRNDRFASYLAGKEGLALPDGGNAEAWTEGQRVRRLELRAGVQTRLTASR